MSRPAASLCMCGVKGARRPFLGCAEAGSRVRITRKPIGVHAKQCYTLPPRPCVAAGPVICPRYHGHQCHCPVETLSIPEG